ncbi:MAG: thiol:disulfide interchange protein DsbC [Candidatus Pseudothioglobus sp.]|jgi:thiol:disulfide interchange protein DsbC
MHRFGQIFAALALGLMAAFSSCAVLAMNAASAPGTVELATDSMVDEEFVRQRLQKVRPELPILSIQRSVMSGLWEVQLPGEQVLFVSGDAQHFVIGELYEVTDTRFVNMTEAGRDVERKQLLAGLDESDMVIFKPASGEPKAVITVFTDIDCGYCRKLHKEVPELNRRGVEVRYLAYPRAGVGSPVYDKMVSAWCSDNPQMAMTLAKGGAELPPRTCENSVAEQHALGAEFGVTGTPTLVFEDGHVVPGYMPADKLLLELGLN